MNSSHWTRLNSITIFQELRFKIDEHRVELKQKIDDTALDLIERTREYEASYLKAIVEKFEKTHLLEQDTFRDPSLLFESMRELQIKHERALNEIKSSEQTKA